MSTEKNVPELPSKEEVIMNEDQLLSGLLEAAKFKEDAKNQKLIRVQRNGKVLFEFHIRPLEESEIDKCHKKSAKYAPSPQNRAIRVEVDVDYVKVRSLKIYTATTDEDRAKIWDNKELQTKLNVLTGVDVIDMVLMAGEKDWICEEIDAISGYNVSLEDIAKN